MCAELGAQKHYFSLDTFGVKSWKSVRVKVNSSAAALSLNTRVLNCSVKFNCLLNHSFIYYSYIPGAYGHIHFVLLCEVSAQQCPF